jgi:hypothetical protein
MHSPEQPQSRPGISAVFASSDGLDRAVLDLAAVLDGLVPQSFEIIVIGDSASTSELRARAPRLPVRTIGSGESVAPAYDLVFVAARDGQFDVRELNRLLDAVEGGADVAAGYRPRRTDAIVRRLQRWGWNVDVDCAFALLRRGVFSETNSYACAEMCRRARRMGFRVVEIPVSEHRPTLGVAASPEIRAA